MELTRVCKDCGRELSVTKFKTTRWGTRVNVCTECATKKRHDNKVRKEQEKAIEQAKAENAATQRQKMLESYTPRELMTELARRGYRGELAFVQKIDITDF